MKKKVTIYWATKNVSTIYDIRRWFNLPTYTSVNGETPCEIEGDMMEKLKGLRNKG